MTWLSALGGLIGFALAAPGCSSGAARAVGTGGSAVGTGGRSTIDGGGGSTVGGTGGAACLQDGGGSGGRTEALDATTEPDDVARACASCEGEHASNGYCPPTLLTATVTIDPDTGDQVAVGWGLDTLATEGERAAGAALLHCLDVNHCSTDAQNACPGNNPVLGCFCGPGVAPIDCIIGAGVHGVCLAAFEAAAAATPGGPPSGSSLETFAAFVTTRGFEPGNPIGLAVNIKRCAIEAPCPVCDGL